jgi:hypothetical protein
MANPLSNIATTFREMEEIERENGGINPDALIPRFMRWWRNLRQSLSQT